MGEEIWLFPLDKASREVKQLAQGHPSHDSKAKIQTQSLCSFQNY